jgi:RNA polymerase sigma factor (sigma-70 family)
MPREAVVFALLLRRLRNGCPEAARAVVHHYSPALLLVIRRTLNQRLQSLLDPDDLLQDAWVAFFVGHAGDDPFSTAGQLLAFLRRTARHKALQANRHHLNCRKADLRRQRSLEHPDVCPDRDLVDRRPTPVEAALAREQWDSLLRGRSRAQRHVLTLLYYGHTRQEIAQQLGIHERTVRRFLEQVRASIPREGSPRPPVLLQANAEPYGDVA